MIQVIAGILLAVFVGGLLYFIFNQGLYQTFTALSSAYPTEMADPGITALSTAWLWVPGLILVVIVIASASEGQKRRLFSLALIAALLLSSLAGGPVPIALADGSTPAQLVFIEWYEDTWTGQGTATSAENNIEFDTLATYMPEFNFSTLPVDYVNVTAMRAWIEWDGTNDAFDRDWTYSVWDYDGAVDAGSRRHNETWTKTNLDGSPLVRAWNTRTLSSPWNLTAGGYFFGAAAEDGAGIVRLEGTTGGAASSSRVYDTNTYGADPFVEANTYATEEASIQLRYLGFNETTTTLNQYYGNSTLYVARYDVNYSAPAGVTLRQLQFTIPSDETLINITASNGGLYDTALPSTAYSVGSYNGTHSLITLGDATISANGWDYRVFAASDPYTYAFTGAFYENGTLYGPINVTATFEDSGNDMTFEVNTTSQLYGWQGRPQAFTWALPGGGTRIHNPRDTFEDITVFVPESTYSDYEVDIIDWTSKVGESNTFLDALRYVNSTRYVIERHLVQNTLLDVAMLLVVGKSYSFRAVLYDDSTLMYSYFIPGLDQNPIFPLRTTHFSDMIHASQEDILFEVSRSPNGTLIQGEYFDEGGLTSYVLFQVELYDYTVEYDSSVADSSDVLFQWNGAGNETDYRVMMTCVTPSSYHGNVTYYYNLPGITEGVSYPFNLTLLGTLSDTQGNPVETEPLFFVFMNLALAFSFSWVNIVAGAFITVLISAIELRMGWMSWDPALLTAAMCFTIMLGIVVAKWRMKGK